MSIACARFEIWAAGIGIVFTSFFTVHALAAATTVIAGVGAEDESEAAVKRLVFTANGSYLALEVKRDDLVHFETGRLPVRDQNIWLSPMIAEQSFSGPAFFQQTSNGFRTAELKVEVDSVNLCAHIEDTRRSVDIGTFCPQNLDQPWKNLQFDSQMTTEAYGLGQYFDQPGETDGNWIGRVWDPLHDSMGNMLRGFAGGANDFSMFPILYGLGENRKNYGVFFDHVYKQMWDFRSRPFTIGAWGDQLRWMVFTGDDLPALRQKYMQLTGRPPVPPKRAFGLWVSEFGYENWQQVDSELSTLRSESFPVEGFCMDLQWFGGTFGDPHNTGMGSLTWDERKFPNPAGKIQAYRNQGIRLMLIEEPYISERLQEHTALANGGYLAKDCATCGATRLSHNPWWGYGGMVDFTNPAASDFWHDFRRQKLYDLGIRDHWLDLGEPEQFNAHAWYFGFPELNKHNHADIHNTYNFRWVEGIDRGYQRNHNQERPFILSRSGTSGIQRFGAALWSGDIGTDWQNLGSQIHTQMQMVLSGVDYYGSDVGGFQRSRGGVEGGTESLYTQWFAYSSLFDVPVRPHSWNLDRARSTSPAKRGHRRSNLANIKQRYELMPYYYSLAYRAWLAGEPVFPPAFFYDQADQGLRSKGHLKMIGPSLLAATSSSHFAVTKDIYLPRGIWYNYHTNDAIEGGRLLSKFPLRINDAFQLPLFARAGAIIPTQDSETTGTDQQTLSELYLKVFSGPDSQFTLYEDDGVSEKLLAGQYASTNIAQKSQADRTTVTIEPAVGRFDGFPTEKNLTVDLVRSGVIPSEVQINGSAVAECTPALVQPPCYNYEAGDRVSVFAGQVPVNQRVQVTVVFETSDEKAGWAHFVCEDGTTTSGTSVYVLGDDPVLGAWNPERAVPLRNNAYPIWTGTVQGLSPEKTYQWKCIKRLEHSSQVVQWEQGANHLFKAQGGFSGTHTGKF